jgi:hypothetical protein
MPTAAAAGARRFATSVVQEPELEPGPEPEPELESLPSAAPAPRTGGSPSNALDLTEKGEKERAERYFQTLYETETKKQDRRIRAKLEKDRYGKDGDEKKKKAKAKAKEATAAVAAIVAVAAGTAATMDFFGSSFEGADGTRNFLVTWLVLFAAGLGFVFCIKFTAAMCLSCCLATNAINDPGQEIDSIRGPNALDYLGCVDDPQY